MDEAYEYFEERLDQLIKYIKGENAECNIFICSMCPRDDKNVSTINDIILRQCDTHNVTHIDAYRGFCNKKVNYDDISINPGTMCSCLEQSQGDF